MSFFFGDSFDCYALPADALLGYWDSGSLAFVLGAGRFSGSRAILYNSTGAWLVKSSGSNDAVHHIVCAYQQTAAITGSTLGLYFQLADGSTNQVCIVFRSDGAIVLTSATPGGTVLATYTGAFTATNTWYSFEFEVVINNTTGSFAVRKNGNTSNDFSASSLNTRPGTNAYANKLTVGHNASVNQTCLDDLLWRSDSAAVPWVGDIRCYTRRPDTDAAAAWTRPSTFQMQPYFGTTGNTGSLSTNQARYVPFVSQGGAVGSVAMPLVAALTGNVKCAIFASTSGQPSTVIQSATAPITNPGIGTNTFTFSPPVTLAKGTQFWVAICPDATIANSIPVASAAPYSTAGVSGITAYASFPVANPGSLSTVAAYGLFPVVTPTYNADAVSEPYEDAAASYVYSSAPGAQDLYTLTGISSTPSTVVGVTTRGLLTKSDAGTRLAAVQLRSGATTVQSAGALSSSAWGWLWRSDTTDPATGTAWTVSGVAAAQIGAQVTG